MPKPISTRLSQVSYSAIRRLFEIARQRPEVLDLGIGEPDIATPIHVVESAKKALDQGYTKYSPNPGFPELRQAIAEKLRRENGIDADPTREIVVTVGGACAIHFALLAILEPGEEVIIPDPGFVTYAPCTLLAGGKPVYAPVKEENEFRLKAEDVEPLITEKTKCMMLNSPQNPTGGVQTKKDLEEIANLAEAYDLYVISDEVYEKLLYDEAQHHSIASLPGMFERTITINSFSKTYAMTGWRLGYLVAPEHIASEVVKIQQNTVACPPSFAQIAAIDALKGSHQHVDDMVKRYDQNRRIIVDRLNKLGVVRCVPPKGAFYAFPNISGLGMSSAEFAEQLLEKKGVAVVPGAAFGQRGEGYVRMCFAQQKAVIEEAVERICEFVEEHS